MMIGARLLRKPPEGWQPPNWNRRVPRPSSASFTRNDAISTVPFYLLWGILFINVTAGIADVQLRPADVVRPRHGKHHRHHRHHG